MKKLIFFTAIILCVVNGKGQITLDFTIDSTIYGTLFYPTKISDNETKYVFIDTVGNKFSLYNLDLTPFVLNVTPPAPLFNGNYYYSVMYLTRTLFDCDSTNIEYLFASQTQGFNKLWILRTDGTVLFQADSTRGPYCLGCPGGTSFLKPILETEGGTKLVLMNDNPPGVKNISIYSLCGQLPVGIYKFETQQQEALVELFPNPASGELNFRFNLPDNINDYELTLLNSNSQEIGKHRLRSSKAEIVIDVINYSSGTYYYQLSSKNKTIQSEKFLIAK